MLPRMNKNSKQIIVQKKKQGGPVFQKYDVKRGVTNVEVAKGDSPAKLVPVQPVTPKGMLAMKRKSRNNDPMLKMFYSKKDLLKGRHQNHYKSKRETNVGGFGREGNEGESKEEMMYRILKKKGEERKREKNESVEEDSGEVDYELEEDEVRTDEKDRRGQRRQRENDKIYETPIQKDPISIKPMMHKSHSMMPGDKKSFANHTPRSKPRESDFDLMKGDSNEHEPDPYGNAFRKDQPNISAFYGDNRRIEFGSRDAPSSKKSTSMKPKKELYDPFKDFTMRQKKYDKNLLREMLELEDMFTGDFSRHIDSMVALVKQDIAIQSAIQEEKGPMKFEESISRVKKVLKSKRESLETMVSSIRRFEARFEQLKKKKQGNGSSRAPENTLITYTRNQGTPGKDMMRPKGNMQGDIRGEMYSSKSMYGFGMKPYQQAQKKISHHEQQYKGFGYQKNSRRQDFIDKNDLYENLMKKREVGTMKEGGHRSGSKKELRAEGDSKAKQKFSMLPNMKFDLKEQGGNMLKQAKFRRRTETEMTKEPMKNYDSDNETSLI